MEPLRTTSLLCPFILLTLNALVCTHIYSQSEDLDSLALQDHYDLADSLYLNQRTSDSLEFQSAQGDIIRSITEKQMEPAEVRRNQLLLLYAILKGRDSWLYPDILQESMAQYPDPTGINHYYFGSVYFKDSAYEEAISEYQKAVDRLRFESEFYLHAFFNLAAAHSESGRNSEAIRIFDSICSPTAQLNKHPGLFPETVECVRINLAAMHITEKNYDDANRALATVDTTLLDDYWRKILRLNEFALSHDELNFHRRDSILDNHLAKLSINEIPIAIHEYFLMAALERQDLPYFLKLQTDLLLQGTSPLLENGSGFKTLLLTEPSSKEFEDIWKSYCMLSTDLRNLRVLTDEDIQSRNAIALKRINDVFNESQIQQAKYKQSFWILLFAITASILLILAFKKYKESQNNKALEASLKSTNMDGMAAFELTREDLRVIGDAITVGKRISDAMLILKKLSARLSYKQENIEKRDLSLVPELHQLNARELKIAQLLDAGFDSKEIARMENVTSEYVYNVRSRIRKKLNIPPDIELNDWFQQWS